MTIGPVSEIWFPYFLEWFDRNPFLGLFFLLLMYGLLRLPFWFVFKMYNRTLRRRNIREHGWPPAHLDADGDFFKED